MKASNWLLVKKGKRHAKVVRLSSNATRAVVQADSLIAKIQDERVMTKLVLSCHRDEIRELWPEWFSSFIV